MTEGRVPAGAIVEAFQVEEDVGHRFLASAVKGMVDQLRLQRTKEALHRRVVVAVATTAHAGRDGMGGQQRLERSAGVLTAAVAMLNQGADRLALVQGRAQGGADQHVRHARRHRPAHNAPRKQVQNDSQVEPLLEWGCG